MTLSTRIGVMNQGEIVQVGEPTEIYEFPNSRFVADFIGSVNMFEGVVTEDEPDHVRIGCPEVGGDIYVGHGVDCAPDQMLWCAIRPEKIRLTRERPEARTTPSTAWSRTSPISATCRSTGCGSTTGKMLPRHQGQPRRAATPTPSPGTRRSGCSWDDTAGVVLTQ